MTNESEASSNRTRPPGLRWRSYVLGLGGVVLLLLGFVQLSVDDVEQLANVE